MYLQTADSLEEVVTYGIDPCIQFLDMAEDLRESGDDDRASMLELQVRGKLMIIKEKLQGLKLLKK